MKYGVYDWKVGFDPASETVGLMVHRSGRSIPVDYLEIHIQEASEVAALNARLESYRQLATRCN